MKFIDRMEFLGKFIDESNAERLLLYEYKNINIAYDINPNMMIKNIQNDTIYLTNNQEIRLT